MKRTTATNRVGRTVAATFALAMLAGCTAAERGVATGSLIGAGIGAIAGDGRGAVIGAGAGAIAGGVIAQETCRKRNRYRYYKRRCR